MGLKQYRPTEIEPKWQREWEKQGIYRAEDSVSRSWQSRGWKLDEEVGSKERSANCQKPKCYVLFEFPYPSGDRLHVGHARSYTALDALARKKRMQGHNVLLPLGWDAFGLPAENYALKMKTTPQKIVPQNIAHSKAQAQSWGLSVDWSKELSTTDPLYYKWTQWIFLKMYEKGLAYQATLPVNWCPSCKIGLANEEVVGGGCERCGTETERRNITQWVLRITDYADRLIDDLALVDYLPKIKAQQINWIGRSEGTNVKFSLAGASPDLPPIEVFTTRADTIYGVTAIVVAPEHPLISLLGEVPSGEVSSAVESLRNQSSRLVTVSQRQPRCDSLRDDVREYILSARRKSELERTDLAKEKTGVFTGLYCQNPITKEQVPIWVGDYVVGSYGGGAVMVVPAHDARDWEFAKKYHLPIKEVVTASAGRSLSQAFTDYGTLVDSGSYTGLTSAVAIQKITADLAARGAGGPAKHFHLRDWVFSRQHYWGEPIPLTHCSKCGVVPVPEEQLPVVLPELEHYEPTGNTESPLAAVTEWVNVLCPKCGGPAKRDTDTMPNWAGSNWYYVGYVLAHELGHFSDGKRLEVQNNEKRVTNSEKRVTNNEKGTPDLVNRSSLLANQNLNNTNIFSANRELLNHWLPVDLYNGGMEHTTLHLLYSRFIYKFLFDLGLVPGPEPYIKRRSHGMVLSHNGEKMSKSRGNVINPDDIVTEFGADTFRLYEMFMGPFDQAISWNQQGVVGVNKFLHRVWRLVLSSSSVDYGVSSSAARVGVLLNNLVKKVSEDLSEDTLKFNTAVAAFMTFLNEVEKTGLTKEQAETFLKLLAPFAPHVTEELWQELGHQDSIHLAPWPVYDPTVVDDSLITVVVQVNGKMQGKLALPPKKARLQAEVVEEATKLPKVRGLLAGLDLKKTFFVPGKLVNFVI